MELKIEKVSENQLELFLSILREIAIWLEEIGKPMWSLEGLEYDNFIRNNQDTDFYICFNNNEPAGAFMLKEENEFWWPEGNKIEDLFLKKLGVRRQYAGMAISNYMIDWVKNEAKRRNKKYVRIEFYADRDNLIRLYEDNKFNQVKRMTMPDGICIALYEHAIKYT
ncbi:MAG: GCN5-related N-acetyltransferase [Paenibacillaceae bacterium]|jgi:GNAT superfamily N-acetyltransferase|nr:GCN5-related N-acetyltransferase [Paenibacillaceae bacterium]